VNNEKSFAKLREEHKKRKLIKKCITYAFLVLWAVVVLFPFYWMLLSSIKSYGEYNAETVPQFLPSSPTLDNYTIAFTSIPLADYFLNTIIFTVITTALMMVIIIPAAFAFARLPHLGRISARPRWVSLAKAFAFPSCFNFYQSQGKRQKLTTPTKAKSEQLSCLQVFLTCKRKL
jgi:ABC-type glycerol-3-phosphate transport system permease component